MQNIFVPLNSINRTKQIQFIVIHYTATHSCFTAYDALKRTNLSAHALIPGPWCHLYPRTAPFRSAVEDPLPDWIELVKPDRAAMHCAGSNYAGTNQTNSHSYGIEITNFGYATSDKRHPNLTTWQPPGEPGNKSFTRLESKIQVLTKRDMTFYNNMWWEPFTETQYNVVAQLTANVINQNDLTADAIIGHEHIDLKKSDPGPLWDWIIFQKKLWPLLSCKTKEKTQSNTNLQIRYAQSHANRIGKFNLTVDGLIGPKTIRALNELRAKYPTCFTNTTAYDVNIPGSIYNFNNQALSF